MSTDVLPTTIAAGLANNLQTCSVDYSIFYGKVSLPDAFLDAECCFTPAHKHALESYQPYPVPDAAIPPNPKQQLRTESHFTFPAHMALDRFSHQPGELLTVEENAFLELSMQQLSPCSLAPAGAGLLRTTSLPVDVSCNDPVPLVQLQQLILHEQQKQQDLELEVLALQHQAWQLQVQQQVLSQQQQVVASTTQLVESMGPAIQVPCMQPPPQYIGMEVAFQGTNAITGAAAEPSPAAPGAYASANTLLPPFTTHGTLQAPHASSRATTQRRYSMLHLPSPPMWTGDEAAACQANAARPGPPCAASMLLLQTPGNLPELVEQHAAAAGLGMAANYGRMYPTAPTGSTSTDSSSKSSCTIKPETVLQAVHSPPYEQAQAPSRAAAPRQVLSGCRNASDQYNSRTRFSLDVVIEGKAGLVRSPPTPNDRQWEHGSPMLDNHVRTAAGLGMAMPIARCASLGLPRSRQLGAVTALVAAKGSSHRTKGEKGPASPAGAPGSRTSWEASKAACASHSPMVSCNTVQAGLYRL